VAVPVAPEADAVPLPRAVPRPTPALAGKPRKGLRPVEQRRRLAVMAPRDRDLRADPPRTPGPTRRFARQQPTRDGAVRSRVAVVYGTTPRPELGPVLIRIHAGRGRLRVSRIPLH
jgi:hypothetical protein